MPFARFGLGACGAACLRPGDGLILLAAAVLIAWLSLSGLGEGGRVVIKQSGQVYRELGLRLNTVVAVPGPLGKTLVEIRDGRVRVQSDPSPRQLCVRQGWLRPGETAVCLPNRVSVELGQADYDSLNH